MDRKLGSSSTQVPNRIRTTHGRRQYVKGQVYNMIFEFLEIVAVLVSVFGVILGGLFIPDDSWFLRRIGSRCGSRLNMQCAGGYDFETVYALS